jgi:hypothetical protein
VVQGVDSPVEPARVGRVGPAEHGQVPGIPLNALPPCSRVPMLHPFWPPSDPASSPIWVMRRRVVGPKLLVDETDAMTRTVLDAVLRSRGAIRFGQDGEMVIGRTSTNPSARTSSLLAASRRSRTAARRTTVRRGRKTLRTWNLLLARQVGWEGGQSS